MYEYMIFPIVMTVILIILVVGIQRLISPDRAAKNVKMMGLTHTAQKQTYVGIKLALEDANFRKMLVESLLNDPEIRAMLYDAFQAEYQKRKR